jgi:hypothetical protein
MQVQYLDQLPTLSFHNREELFLSDHPDPHQGEAQRLKCDFKKPLDRTFVIHYEHSQPAYHYHHLSPVRFEASR